MRDWIAVALGLMLVGSTALAEEPVPMGEEFQVNTYTTGYQREPAVAADPLGNFVVVWDSDGSYNTSLSSIQAQRFSVGGAPAGSQFQVNSYTTGPADRPAVAADSQGTFVVVWRSYGSDGTDTSESSIQGQRFAADGQPSGAQFQVNSYTTSYQSYPAVAAEPQGTFVVVWRSYGSDGTDTSESSIQGQRFAADGQPSGAQFQVNSYTTGFQSYPAVATDSQGNFLVVWESDGSYGSDDSFMSIQAQLYDASGSRVGAQFQVNTLTSLQQWDPAVTADADGNFIVVWESLFVILEPTSIQAQRFAPSGSPVGGELQVNSYTTGSHFQPAVAVEPQGDFVVVWTSDSSYGTDSSHYSIQGQRFDPSGSPAGGQFQVNSYTTGLQYGPVVAAEPQGTFVVVWHSEGSHGTDTSGYSIHGQIFSTPIFADGFESGDTSSWSSTFQ